MKVINSLKSRLVRIPIQQAADLAVGTLVIKGATAETDLGVAIEAANASASTYIGILAELHDYSENGSALVAGAAHSAVIPAATGAAWFAPAGGNEKLFPSRLVELVDYAPMVRIDYDTTGIAVTNSSSTTVTVGSLEDNIDTSFLYASAGEALGELRFVATSASGSCVTSNAFTTMTSAGYIVKMPPLFHNLFYLATASTTAGQKIGTSAAAGAARLMQLERHIIRNGCDEMMDPYTHGNLSGLDHLAQLQFYGVFSFNATIFTPLS